MNDFWQFFSLISLFTFSNSSVFSLCHQSYLLSFLVADLYACLSEALLHFLICCSKSDVDWEIQWSQLLKLGLKLRKIFVTLTTSAPDSSAFFLVVSSLLAIEKKNNQVSVLWIRGDKSHTGDNHAELMGRFMHWKQSARCYCQEILRIFIIFLS